MKEEPSSPYRDGQSHFEVGAIFAFVGNWVANIFDWYILRADNNHCETMFGLFKDDGEAGNDALKFQAPKASALKKQQKAELARQNNDESANSANLDNGTYSQGAVVDSVQKSPSTPQIFFSSSIYLYRVNNAGTYEIV